MLAATLLIRRTNVRRSAISLRSVEDALPLANVCYRGRLPLVARPIHKQPGEVFTVMLEDKDAYPPDWPWHAAPPAAPAHSAPPP